MSPGDENVIGIPPPIICFIFFFHLEYGRNRLYIVLYRSGLAFGNVGHIWGIPFIVPLLLGDDLGEWHIIF